ncbi:MAG: oligosaccharide flippase family protein [Halobacteriota archaeon]
MNTVQRIAKNTSVLLFAQIASYIIGFFFIMYTARYLGAEGFGILVVLLSKILSNIFIQTNTIFIHASEIVHIQDKGKATNIIHDESRKRDVCQGNCKKYEGEYKRGS